MKKKSTILQKESVRAGRHKEVFVYRRAIRVESTKESATVQSNSSTLYRIFFFW